VEWQLRIASGQPIPVSQEEIIANAKGCAVEARVYAENPMNGFLPSTGYISHMQTSLDMGEFQEDGVRVDNGVKAGDTVSSFYDPMIAKLIAYADTRPEAIRKLERALRHFQVAGLANNIDFLVQTVRHPGFAIEQPTTAFFDDHLQGILADLDTQSGIAEGEIPLCSDAQALALAAFVEASRTQSKGLGGAGIWSDCKNDWRGFGNSKRSFDMKDSNGSAQAVKMTLEGQGNELTLMTSQSVVKKGEAAAESKSLACKVVSCQPGASSTFWRAKVQLEGSRYVTGDVSIYTHPATKATILDVWVEGQYGADATHSQLILPAKDFSASDSSSGRPIVLAPMPGRVVKVMANNGDVVEAGATLVIMEAMKMEHVITAPCKGLVRIHLMFMCQ
jgi:3-methylcrotonyl-CoA carboxylase alpha subunit